MPFYGGGGTTLPSNYVTNAMVNASAAIAYSKLNLTNSIVAGDLTTAAKNADVVTDSYLSGAATDITLGTSLANARAWEFAVWYALGSSSTQTVNLSINGDTGNNYQWGYIKRDNTTVSGVSSTTGAPEVLNSTDHYSANIHGYVFQRDPGSVHLPQMQFTTASNHYNGNTTTQFEGGSAWMPASADVTSIEVHAGTTQFPIGTRYWLRAIAPV